MAAPCTPPQGHRRLLTSPPPPPIRARPGRVQQPVAVLVDGLQVATLPEGISLDSAFALIHVELEEAAARGGSPAPPTATWKDARLDFACGGDNCGLECSRQRLRGPSSRCDLQQATVNLSLPQSLADHDLDVYTLAGERHVIVAGTTLPDALRNFGKLYGGAEAALIFPCLQGCLRHTLDGLWCSCTSDTLVVTLVVSEVWGAAKLLAPSARAASATAPEPHRR